MQNNQNVRSATKKRLVGVHRTLSAEMQDIFTVQQSNLKMTGIPLIPGELPGKPILNFAKRLSTLQGTLATLQPSLVLMLHILITNTLSMVGYMF